ncbi:MAG: M14 family metallopeptidase [Candidatus Paceibacterota bacterium]
MKTFIIVLIVILLGVGAYLIFSPAEEGVDRGSENVTTEGDETSNLSANGEEDEAEQKGETVIGQSVDGHDIVAYHYGQGDTEILFVGGIHGGYAWNTSLVAFELMDYLKRDQTVIPENVRVTVVPVLNPDGLEEVMGTTGRFTQAEALGLKVNTTAGRFNANGVDLNRNFDCQWQSTGTWRNTPVDGGDEPFSEPESQAIKNYVTANQPKAVIVWYSAAGGVFASACDNDVLAETNILTNLYAKAAGYPAYEEFDFYEITGDMVNWLAKENIPAISVLLSSHEDIEWSKNRSGVIAVLKHYAR